MAGINIRKFLNSFSQNYNQRSANANTAANSSSNIPSANSNLVPMDTSGPKLPAQNVLSQLGQNIKTSAQSLKLNVLQNADRATYIKDVLDLPKNLNEFVYMIQRNLTKQQVTKTLENQQPQQTGLNQPKTLSNIQSQILQQQAYIKTQNTNQQILQQNNSSKTLSQQGQSIEYLPGNATGQALSMQGQNALSGQIIKNNAVNLQKHIVNDINKQIIADIKDVSVGAEVEETTEIVLSKELQTSLKKLEIISGGMINLGNISKLLQKNGKAAITKIIMTMTEASKSGITDLSQMKDMAKLVNASISVAAENNPQKTLKLFLMLYLPWLPLEDGVGFDIEIQEHKDASIPESDSILVITVTTINFGTVKATLVLETSNSVQVSIESADNFPKKELKLRIEKEQTYYSMDSVISFKTDTNIKQNSTNKQAAAINMSQTTEINPYLLLMAHALIKNIIEIDNNKTLGITLHEDKF